MDVTIKTGTKLTPSPSPSTCSSQITGKKNYIK